MKWSILVVGSILCPAVFVCVCFREREKKSCVVRAPARTTTSQQHREGEQGPRTGGGSHQQAQTTAHQSVSAQTPQASYSQASESRNNITEQKKKGRQRDIRRGKAWRTTAVRVPPLPLPLSRHTSLHRSSLPNKKTQRLDMEDQTVD